MLKLDKLSIDTKNVNVTKSQAEDKLTNASTQSLDGLMVQCKNINDIETAFQEFEYFPDKSLLICQICYVKDPIDKSNVATDTSQPTGTFSYSTLFDFNVY